MSEYKYAYRNYEEDMARAVGRDLGISLKQAIEITKGLRNKDLEKAQAKLNRVIEKKEAVKFTRFTNGLGHKPGMAAGRYPIKACVEILKLLNQVEANAQTKGLGRCKIVHIAAQQANKPQRYGRKSRVEMKRAHVEVVVKEIEAKPKKSKHDSKKQDKDLKKEHPAGEEK